VEKAVHLEGIRALEQDYQLKDLKQEVKRRPPISTSWSVGKVIE